MFLLLLVKNQKNLEKTKKNQKTKIADPNSPACTYMGLAILFFLFFWVFSMFLLLLVKNQKNLEKTKKTKKNKIADPNSPKPKKPRENQKKQKKQNCRP